MERDLPEPQRGGPSPASTRWTGEPRAVGRPGPRTRRGAAGGIGTPPRLRRRRDGDPRASNFRTAVDPVVPAPDSPSQALHAMRPTGPCPAVAGRSACPARRRRGRLSGRARISGRLPRRPHGSAQPITIGNRRSKRGILRVGGRTLRVVLRHPSASTQRQYGGHGRSGRPVGARTNALTPPSVCGTRRLGIPTVVDRLIRQALHEVMSRVFEPGFRNPATGSALGAAPHDAVLDRRPFRRRSHPGSGAANVTSRG